MTVYISLNESLLLLFYIGYLRMFGLANNLNIFYLQALLLLSVLFLSIIKTYIFETYIYDAFYFNVVVAIQVFTSIIINYLIRL